MQQLKPWQKIGLAFIASIVFFFLIMQVLVFLVAGRSASTPAPPEVPTPVAAPTEAPVGGAS